MRRRPTASRVALGLAFLVGSLDPGNTAWAAVRPAKQPDTGTLSSRALRVQELRDLMGEASSQEAALLEELAGIEARLDDLDDAVWDLTRQTRAAQRRLSAAERTLRKAEADQEAALRRLGEVQAQVDATRQRMNQTLATMYRRGSSEEQAVYAALVEGASNAHDLFSGQRYVAGSIRSDRRRLDHYVTLRVDADRLRLQVNARAEEIRGTRDEQLAERDRLEGLKQQALANRAAARSEERRRQVLLREVRNRKSDFEEELRALQAESGYLSDFLRLIQTGQVLGPRRRGMLEAPVDAPVSSGFGTRVHPIFGEPRMHTGIDYAVGTGHPIRAARSGVVVWAGPRGGYGTTVVIDHRRGLATVYAHQSRVNVRVGQRVKAGQVVGYVGQSGMSTGPHLHFEARELGTPVDPRFYL